MSGREASEGRDDHGVSAQPRAARRTSAVGGKHPPHARLHLRLVQRQDQGEPEWSDGLTRGEMILVAIITAIAITGLAVIEAAYPTVF